MTQSLQDRSILVAGGTSGIGLAVTRAALHAGAQVVAAGLDVPEAIDNPAVHWLQGDLQDPDFVARCLETVVSLPGTFQGLVHVAGGSGRRFGDGPLHEVPVEGWRATLQLNLETVYLTNRAAIAHWLQTGSPGSIVNVGSVLARHPAPRHFATHGYAAAKAGLEGLTQAAAAYYAPSNIRLNVVAPGLVETPMSQRAVQAADIVDYARHRQPLDGGRVGRPTDLSDAIVFLLSDAAAWITGQVWNVDGGWSVSDGVARDAK